jgi:hypothetical protein
LGGEGQAAADRYHEGDKQADRHDEEASWLPSHLPWRRVPAWRFVPLITHGVELTFPVDRLRRVEIRASSTRMITNVP